MKLEKTHIAYNRLLTMSGCTSVALTGEMEIHSVTPDHTSELATEENEF
jgi:hypothetical protein